MIDATALIIGEFFVVLILFGSVMLLIGHVVKGQKENRSLIHDLFDKQVRLRHDLMAVQSQQVRELGSGAVVVTDMTGKVTRWDIQTQQLLGWSPEDAIGKSITDLIIPEDMKARHEKGLAYMRDSATSRSYHAIDAATALHKNGREIPVSVQVSTMLVGDTRLAVGVMRPLIKDRDN